MTSIMANMQNQLLEEREVAEYLRISVITLRNWRSARRELPYIKVGGMVRYRSKDIENYLKDKTVEVVRL